MQDAIPAFDIWSTGVIFYELINGFVPYKINDKLIDVEEVFKKERVPLSTKDPETIRIVNLMLEKD